MVARDRQWFFLILSDKIGFGYASFLYKKINTCIAEKDIEYVFHCVYMHVDHAVVGQVWVIFDI